MTETALSRDSNGLVAPERIGKYEVHPLASLFPLLDGERYVDLVNSIGDLGQIHPIVVDQHGRLIDGRNRLRALIHHGREPIVEIRTFKDDREVAKYLRAANVERRHLNTAQRAFLSARLREGLREQATENQKRGKDLPPNVAGGDSRDLAAVAAGGVSHTYTSIAEKAKQTDSRIETLADDGKITSMPKVKELLNMDAASRDAEIARISSGMPPSPTRSGKMRRRTQGRLVGAQRKQVTCPKCNHKFVV